MARFRYYKRQRNARRHYKTSSSWKRRSALPRSIPQARPSAGSIIVNGVRNLISYLPSSTFLSPAADFIMSYSGLVSTTSTPKSIMDLLVHVTGGQSAFIVSYVNLIASSSVGLRLPSASSGNLHNFIRLDYTEARLVRLSISLAFTNRMQSRSGTITLGFWPFISGDAEQEWTNQFKEGNQYLTDVLDQNIVRMPYVVIGQTGKTLTLAYRPRIHDGQLFQFRPVASRIGGVFIKFTDFARSQYDLFSGDELGLNCVVQGVVQLRNTSLRADSAVELIDSVVDNCVGDHTCIKLVKDIDIPLPTDTATFKSFKAGRCLKIAGDKVRRSVSSTTGCLMRVDLTDLLSNVDDDSLVSGA